MGPQSHTPLDLDAIRTGWSEVHNDDMVPGQDARQDVAALLAVINAVRAARCGLCNFRAGDGGAWICKGCKEWRAALALVRGEHEWEHE